MKIRNGFVSNSSSASFICEICDTVWREDRDPLLIGGVCDECQKEHQICNVCGDIGPVEDFFETRGQYVHIKDVPRLKDQEVEDPNGDPEFFIYHTCSKCLSKPENEGVLKWWMGKSDYSEWLKKVAQPDHELRPIDKKISEIILKSGK